MSSIQHGIRVGIPAPPFQLPDLNGEPISLGEFRGRPVLLTFLRHIG